MQVILLEQIVHCFLGPAEQVSNLNVSLLYKCTFPLIWRDICVFVVGQIDSLKIKKLVTSYFEGGIPQGITHKIIYQRLNKNPFWVKSIFMWTHFLLVKHKSYSSGNLLAIVFFFTIFQSEERLLQFLINYSLSGENQICEKTDSLSHSQKTRTSLDTP